MKTEVDVPGMTDFLDGLKYNEKGLVAVIVQNVDSGEIAMQAFADRAALSETLQTGLATFYSRSRSGRWCKGETSGNFIRVLSVHPDCDRDSIIYLSEPMGPSCHTGARNCWFSSVLLEGGAVMERGEHHQVAHMPRTSLQALEYTIEARKQEASASPDARPSWTVKLLNNPDLLCKKIREEAAELCETWERNEGRERAASEMADLLYHSLVMLNLQGVPMEDVLRELRGRFGTSGIEEKAARAPK